MRLIVDDDEAEELGLDIDAKKLNQKERDAIDSDKFAVPGKRKLPIHDAAHVRNALARFNQTKGLTPAEKSTAMARIRRAAKKFGIDVKAAEGFPGDMSMQVQFVVEAVGLDLPAVKDHPNRMPFTGVLTKVGLPSDKPPNGTDGKKVLLTHDAVEAALASLIGMGVDLAKDMDGHDVKSKVGLITDAVIDGEDLRIRGFIYAADFPQEALKIHMKQSQLGFSFEAQNIAVESLDDDPLVVKSCVFTGAAILMKDAAAYQTTSLAASAAKEHEMDDIKKAIADALATALAPVTDQLGKVAAAQADLTATVDDLKKAPPKVEATIASMCASVEPHAKNLEAAADQMEKNGVGLHPHLGHVHFARRMASSMRADAAQGKLPHEFRDSASYWASADHRGTQPTNVKETPEYKALQAELETVKASAKADADKAAKEQADALASLNTKLADLTAKVEGRMTAGSQPDRKTIPAEITALLSKHGITAPEGEDGKVSIAKIDEALAGVDLNQRMIVKTKLLRSGIVAA